MKIFSLLLLVLLLAGCEAWGFHALPTRTPTTQPGTTPSAIVTPISAATAQPARPSATRSPNPLPYPATCTVSRTGGDVLNVRARPGMEAPILGGLLPGQEVTVITWGKDWHKVTTGSLTGYISARYCEAQWK